VSADERDYVVHIAGLEWLLDAATFREVDDWLDGLELAEHPDRRFARHTIDDLSGATVTFFAADVQSMCIASPESRRFQRQRSKDLKDEGKEQGFLDDD
jgi:hypothetical protein